MSLQQVVQSRSSANGFGRRRADREVGTRVESKLHSGKSFSSSFSNAGLANGGKIGGYESPSRDRLIYVTTCLIGHRVEVQVKNGSIFTGIFHATSTEKEFGIILKMAWLIKDASYRGQKPFSDSVSKAPSKTFIIPAKELVQVIAKDVPLTGNEFTNGHSAEKRQDIMIDSFISQPHYVEVERELERWAPDKDDPQCPELENIFDGTWNRNWDQFETNEALFGVKSTFDEELYTTKLERGPQTRKLEREALRIAREIEGEETEDLHLAEERGIHLDEEFGPDEESRFSSVFREIDDGRFEENDDLVLDVINTETFGASSCSVISGSFSDITRVKSNDGAQASPSCSSVEEGPSSHIPVGRDLYTSNFGDHMKSMAADSSSKNFLAMDGEIRINENQIRDQLGGKNELSERKILMQGHEEAQSSKSDEIHPVPSMKKASSDKVGLSPSATAYSPSSRVPSKGEELKGSLGENSECAGSGKSYSAIQPVNVGLRPGSSASSTSECINAAPGLSGPGFSPSSSVGSLSSERSTLNPYAMEFKLNPNAKSFTPSVVSVRAPAPVSEGSFYFPTNVAAVPHMQGLPVGVGMGPSFGGHQPVIYNPQVTPLQAPQAYIHPNGPLYGQQMFVGQPRQVLYMPSFPPEMQYKGRDF